MTEKTKAMDTISKRNTKIIKQDMILEAYVAVGFIMCVGFLIINQEINDNPEALKSFLSVMAIGSFLAFFKFIQDVLKPSYQKD